MFGLFKKEEFKIVAPVDGELIPLAGYGRRFCSDSGQRLCVRAFKRHGRNGISHRTCGGHQDQRRH